MKAPATVLLGAAVVGSYLLELAHGGLPVCEVYGLVPAHASFGTAVSSLFIHDPSGFAHVGWNLAFLLVFGGVVERALGGFRLLVLFFAAGLGGAAMHVLVNPASTEPLVGCSGAICGILAVAGGLQPRLLGFVVAFIGLNIWHSFTGPDGTVSFGCHLGGFIVGAVAVVCMRVFGSELEVA